MPTVETNGIETYYERHGEGPPIVCAPGSGWDHRSWYPQVEGLRDEFELILYDPRGHGRTGYGGRDEISVELLATDVGALVDRLELEQPAVVGCSLGGLIAHAYAASEPSNVGALVTLEAPVGMTDRPLPMRIVQRMYITGSRILGPDRIYGVLRRFDSLLGEGDQWADQTLPGLDMTKGEYADDALSHTDAEVMMRMGSILRYEATDLESITAPTLVLTGADPGAFFEDAAEELVERIPDSRRDRIPDAGHGAHMDNPEAYNETVKAFLDDAFDERDGRTAES